MNLKEAYQILEIPESSSKEDAKKAFKKLASKYHPDVNKDVDAESKFKKINEAWQIIELGKQPLYEHVNSGWGNTNFDFFRDFINISNPRTSKRFSHNDIFLHETVSFKESVLGCERNIKYSRNNACEDCYASGKVSIHNGCTTCNGVGRITRQQGNITFLQTCSSCKGVTQFEDCKKCKGVGAFMVDYSATVRIPPRVIDNNILNLGNRGHFIGMVMGSENNTRVLLQIKVIPQDKLSIKDDDVISSMNISLLESLQGCDKTVTTIDGNKDITIPPNTKNKDELTLPKLGVERYGNQVVIVNVEYPYDTKELINFLKGN